MKNLISKFPPAFSDFVLRYSEALQTPPELLFYSSLAGLSALVPPTLRVCPWGGWEEPLGLWVCISAESGSNKSRAIEAGLEYLLQKQRKYYDEYRAQTEEESEPLRRICAHDITYEALIASLSHNSNLLWYCDELGHWFERLKTGTTNNLAGVLSLYDGRAQPVSRKTGNDREIIPQNRVNIAVCGGIQPMTLRRIFRETRALENGLAYRFLTIQTPLAPRDWSRRMLEVDEYTALKEAFLKFFHIFETGLTVFEDYRMKLSPAAREYFVQILNQLETFEAIEYSARGKGRGHILRLAGVFCLMFGRAVIDQSDIDLAFSAWRFAVQSQEKVVQEVTTSWLDSVSDKVLDFVLASSEPLDIRAVRNRFCASQRPSVTQTVDILNKLAAQNAICLLKTQTIRGEKLLAMPRKIEQN